LSQKHGVERKIKGEGYEVKAKANAKEKKGNKRKMEREEEDDDIVWVKDVRKKGVKSKEEIEIKGIRKMAMEEIEMKRKAKEEIEIKGMKRVEGGE
jgi:hypothetical protein